MKPSERITQLIERDKALQVVTGPSGGPFWRSLEDLLRPVVQYLDEQAALEQRRRRVLKALHYLTVFGVEEARHELALAGLRELRLPPSLAAAPFPDRIDAVARILQAAEREGLL